MTSTLDNTMETVMKNIYTSCDPDNANLVPVSKIIDFITPYMLEDISALESLRSALDPQNTNVCISSEKFFELMNDWTNKISNSSNDDSSDFNRTPSKLDNVDDRQLPYTQSTPRASFGQKLLSCEGLLNLSNVSSYSLSTSMQSKENNTVAAEKTILEEEIKRLEHHLSKLTNEMIMVKLQLTTAEEQNEVLQADLDRCKTRLHSEQQIVEHLQNDKRYNDELREELNSSKKHIEELTKKLLQYEKDNHHLYGLIEQTEKESTSLESRCEELSRREQDAKKEIINFKTELDLKEQEITTILKINEELKIKLNEQRDLIDQLSSENELLNHKKDTLEKALRENMSTRRDSIVSQYKTCLADFSNFANLDESSEEECFSKVQQIEEDFPGESLQAEICQVSTDKDKFDYAYTVLPHENNENQNKHEEKNRNYVSILVYQEEINKLKIQNDNMQVKLDIIKNDNEKLKLEITEMKNKMIISEQDLSNLLIEKNQKETNLRMIQEEKKEIENELKEFKIKISELKDENNNLVENNKSVKNILEIKNKMLIELDEKLLEVKRECTNLQIENITKEKELCEFKNKFDFESAFKKIQIDLNDKNKEISVIKTSNDELKELLNKITHENRELQKSLKQTTMNLKEHEEKSKEVLKLNENIEYTTSQVQLYIDKKNSMISELVELNKKFEVNISTLQKKLQMKIKEVTDLKDCLKRDIEIKNIMWRDNKELKLSLETQIENNKELQNKLDTINEKEKELTEEYNILFSKYSTEIDNNSELRQQILMEKEELHSALAKYNEEVEKNHKLYEQISVFKDDIESISIKQNEYKENINKKLTNYDELIENLEKKLQEQRLQNENLKVELETERKKFKKERFFDVDIAPSESRSRSFEKQKLSIDRLREKLEATEVQLQNEKTKVEKLRNMIQEKDDLEEKFVNAQVDFEQMQVKNRLEKQTLQNTISDLLEKINIQEENYSKLETITTEKENILSSKLSQVEQQNQHLISELTNKDILINNTLIETEKYKGLIANADRKSQELLTKLSSSKLLINDKEKKIHLLHIELTEKNKKILSLSAKIADLESHLSKIQTELADKINININLEKQNKSLQEMLSKSDDHKEQELMDTEQKLKSTCRLLQCSEMELNLIHTKVSNAREEFDIITKDIHEHRNIISIGGTELSRVSCLALKAWENYLEGEDMYKKLLVMKEDEPSERGNELVDLNNKIQFAVFLLEILATKAPRLTEDSKLSIESIDVAPSDGKTIKKFTLRPPRLNISRPASPDSPSIDFDEPNTENVQETKITENRILESHICVCSTDDSYETACEELSFSQISDLFEITLDDAFPNVSDTFLEKLGLHGSSPKKNITKEETERLFTTFAIQIALDSKDIKKRLQKRKDICIEQYEHLFSLLKDILNIFKSHKCLEANTFVTPVYVLLEELNCVLKDMIQSAGQFGILICENRMLKCWNMVTNYMALLKQDVVKLENNQNARSQNMAVIDEGNSMGTIRRRSQNFPIKEEHNYETSVVLKEDVKVNLSRCRYFPSVRSTITLVIFLVFFVFILFIIVHWQCRMTVPETQVCVLDDFIKKIHVGNPPY